MQQQFDIAASPLTPEEEQRLQRTERELRRLGVQNFEHRADGMIIVPGHMDLFGLNLTELPDLSCVIVKGNFSCRNNLLRSLKGAPAEVGGNFDCRNNLLTSLHGASACVGGDFRCDMNQLTTLEGGPKFVGLSFSCTANQLPSLRGAPEFVGKHFSCYENYSLQYLEGAPKTFTRLIADAASYATYTDIPCERLYSPERQRERMEEAIAAATVLQASMRTVKPFRFNPAKVAM